MLESLHSLTGAVIAYKIGNPALSLPLAFISHFVIDLFPHWNPGINHEKKKLGYLSPRTTNIIFLDCLLGLFFSLYLSLKVLPNTSQALLILAGSFLAILPDLAEAPFFFSNSQSPFLKKLVKFQSRYQWSVPLWPGIIFQVVYGFLLFYLLAR